MCEALFISCLVPKQYFSLAAFPHLLLILMSTDKSVKMFKICHIASELPCMQHNRYPIIKLCSIANQSLELKKLLTNSTLGHVHGSIKRTGGTDVSFIMLAFGKSFLSRESFLYPGGPPAARLTCHIHLSCI